MTLIDLAILLVVFGFFGCSLYKKRQKKESLARDSIDTPSNYEALRNKQASSALHGVSIVSLYYDSPLSYADMEKDGTNANFDLMCETKVNDALKALKADGYEPTINAISCVDRVIFYIIY